MIMTIRQGVTLYIRLLDNCIQLENTDLKSSTLKVGGYTGCAP